MAGESVELVVMFVNEQSVSVTDDVRVESDALVCDARENAKIPLSVSVMLLNRLDCTVSDALDMHVTRGEAEREKVAIVSE